jgi:hypothetical protein
LDFIGLMCGKLSIEDVKKPNIAKRLKKDCITVPPFMEDMD